MAGAARCRDRCPAAGRGARAKRVSDKPDAATVTFYHDEAVSTSSLTHPSDASWMRGEGIAFITETRTLDLPAGPADIRFRGVASTMVPQTADIQGSTCPRPSPSRTSTSICWSPGSLLAKSIGNTVHLVRTDPKTGKRSE